MSTDDGVKEGRRARKKREVSDICLFKEKEKDGVTKKINKRNEWADREKEKESRALRNHFSMSRSTRTGKSQMVRIGCTL